MISAQYKNIWRRCFKISKTALVKPDYRKSSIFGSMKVRSLGHFRSLSAGMKLRGVDNNRMKFNHPHPALWRFGDDVLSEVYAEAINFADEEGDNAFQYRDWTTEMGEKRAGERATDPKAGNLYQTCLAFVIDNETPRVVPPGPGEPATFRRAVGTLVLGFQEKPDGDLLNKAHQIMREWALDNVKKTDPKRGGLIAWLKKEFDLGGPLLRATPNTLDNRWLQRR